MHDQLLSNAVAAAGRCRYALRLPPQPKILMTPAGDVKMSHAPILQRQQPHQVDVAYADVAALRQHALHVQVQGMQVARRVLRNRAPGEGAEHVAA